MKVPGGRVGGEQWRAQHAARRKGQEPDLTTAWSASHRLSGLTQTERAKDVVDLCYEITKNPNMIIDVSQNGSRSPWSCRVGSLVRHSEFYCMSLDRTIQAPEHLRLLGFPTSRLRLSMSHAECKDVSGEAMGAPSIGIVVYCLLHSTSFEEPLFGAV